MFAKDKPKTMTASESYVIGSSATAKCGFNVVRRTILHRLSKAGESEMNTGIPADQ
jgi:hypothetical protein